MTADPQARRVSVVLGASGFRTECTAGSHRLVADEPGTLGGEDSGPSPVQMFLMSLGACKAMTMRMYAERKGWSLEGVEIQLGWEDRRPEGIETGPLIPHIEIEMTLTGDLDDAQRNRILDIADKCPVSKVVTGNSVMTTALMGGE
ncbi:MAG: OsmC family protein [Planctomycetota bacterium]